MSQVFRELSIEWGGEKRAFTPTIKMLRRIKGDGVNNLQLASDCLTGAVDPSELAVAMHHVLLEAGLAASPEECYGFLTSGDAGKISEFQVAYVESVMPHIDLGKKPDAQSKQAPVPRAKKSKAK